MTLHVQWCKAHRKSKDTVTLIFCPMCLVDEQERTAKPACECREHEFRCENCPDLKPVPTRTCSHVDETAPVAYPEVPPMPEPPVLYADEPVPDGWGYARTLEAWGRDLARMLTEARAEVDHLKAQVERLKASVDESDSARQQGWNEVSRLKAELAQAPVKERERIIACITDPHNNILWIVPGSSHIHAIHADPRVIRAALEPKEGPCS